MLNPGAMPSGQVVAGVGHGVRTMRHLYSLGLGFGRRHPLINPHEKVIAQPSRCLAALGHRFTAYGSSTTTSGRGVISTIT